MDIPNHGLLLTQTMEMVIYIRIASDRKYR